MRRPVRFSILITVLLTSLILTLNKVNLPSVYKKTNNNFSALNVAEDIKFISKEPHSVKHPKERERVREYLNNRLNILGMDTEYLKYDSVKDRFGEFIDIANIYAVAEPPNGIGATSYVLLMAHLDSRFKAKKKGTWVTSFGAADDGYGLGAILELVRVSNYYKNYWNQGIKVLFTDSEESDLEGIKSTLRHDKNVFDNVGLIINIEARGIKGPAVMFETSPGNSKIVRLFSEGNSLYSYSFTSAIYKILPNYTDFTLIKHNFPGMNFAVIDNLDYYHTDLDNFGNISLNSIQHYGNQISPILKEFLIKDKYSDSAYLQHKTDYFYFTIPLLGLIVIPPALYYLLIISVIFSFILLFVKRLYYMRSLLYFVKSILIIILSIVAIGVLGFLISYITAVCNGVDFNLIYLPFINGDDYIFISSLILISSINFMIYRYINIRLRIDSNDIHISALFLIIILTIASHLYMDDSVLFSIVMVMSFISFLINSIRKFENFAVLPIFFILTFSIPIIYLLNAALTIGSLSIILSFCSLILWQIIPIADGYLRREI
ncbi:MAG: M28 family peptidase [Bacteroidales bacterium]